jgi:DNA-binding MarR family transcriptional regulator
MKRIPHYPEAPSAGLSHYDTESIPISAIGDRPGLAETRHSSRLAAGRDARDEAAMSTLRLDAFLPYRLSVASNIVSDLVAEAYDRMFGLTIPQWRVIAILGEGDPLTQLEIVRQSVMDKMTVSRAVRPLIDRGLILTAPHADKRSRLLTLSDTGTKLYESVAPEALAMERTLLAEFSGEEIDALRAALAKLEEASARLSQRRAR